MLSLHIFSASKIDFQHAELSGQVHGASSDFQISIWVPSGTSRLYMYAKFRVTECVLDPKIVKNFLGGSAPEPPAGYPFSDVHPRQGLGVVPPQSLHHCPVHPLLCDSHAVM